MSVAIAVACDPYVKTFFLKKKNRKILTSYAYLVAKNIVNVRKNIKINNNTAIAIPRQIETKQPPFLLNNHLFLFFPKHVSLYIKKYLPRISNRLIR